MKKTLVWLLAAVLCLGLLGGCGSANPPASSSALGTVRSSAGEDAASQESTPSREESPAIYEEDPAGDPVPVPVDYGVPEEPLALGVECAQGYVYALKGSYEWTHELEDGTMEAVCSDSVHPLDLSTKTIMPRLNGEGEVWFRSLVNREEYQPNEITICAWPDTAWGDSSAESREIPWDGDSFSLLEGGWIYHLILTWDQEEAWGGTCTYNFYGVNTPEALALEEDGTLYEEPGAMTVTLGEESVSAARGFLEDWGAEFQESMVAVGGGGDYRDLLEAWDSLPALSGTGEVTLSWELPPPDVMEVWAVSPNGDRQEVPWNGEGFSLLEGERAYEVTCVWNAHNRWGGTQRYGFRAGP